MSVWTFQETRSFWDEELRPLIENKNYMIYDLWCEACECIGNGSIPNDMAGWTKASSDFYHHNALNDANNAVDNKLPIAKDVLNALEALKEYLPEDEFYLDSNVAIKYDQYYLLEHYHELFNDLVETFYPKKSQACYYIPLGKCYDFIEVLLELAKTWKPDFEWQIIGTCDTTKHMTVVCFEHKLVFDPVFEELDIMTATETVAFAIEPII